MELKNKVVVITGGTKGFGKELATLFLKEGAKVTICSQNKDEVEKIAQELGALGICADVTKEEDLTNLAEQTLKQYGGLNIWINNAGLWMDGLVEDADMDKVRKMFDVNMIGTINGTRVALRIMKKNNSGTIINILSRAALGSRPEISLYAATKWGLNGFTKSIRDENKNLSIFSVFPGGMKTKIFADNVPNNYGDFMDAGKAAQKVIDNLKLEKPEEEIIIKREEI